MGFKKGKPSSSAFIRKGVTLTSDPASANPNNKLSRVSRSTQIRYINRRIQTQPLDLFYSGRHDPSARSNHAAEVQTSEAILTQSLATNKISVTTDCANANRSMQTKIAGTENFQQISTEPSSVSSYHLPTLSENVQPQSNFMSGDSDFVPGATEFAPALNQFTESSLSSIGSIHSANKVCSVTPAKVILNNSDIKTPSQYPVVLTRKSQSRYSHHRPKTFCLNSDYLTAEYPLDTKSTLLKSTADKYQYSHTATDTSETSVYPLSLFDRSSQTSPSILRQYCHISSSSNSHDNQIILPSLHTQVNADLLPVHVVQESSNDNKSIHQPNTNWVHLKNCAISTSVVLLDKSCDRSDVTPLLDQQSNKSQLDLINQNIKKVPSNSKNSEQFRQLSTKSNQCKDVLESSKSNTEYLVSSNVSLKSDYKSHLSHSKSHHGHYKSHTSQSKQDDSFGHHKSHTSQSKQDDSVDNRNKGQLLNLDYAERPNSKVKKIPIIECQPSAASSIPTEGTPTSNTKREPSSFFASHTAPYQLHSSLPQISKSTDTRFISRCCQTEIIDPNSSDMPSSHNYYLSPIASSNVLPLFKFSQSGLTSRRHQTKSLRVLVPDSAETYIEDNPLSGGHLGYSSNNEVSAIRPPTVICYICGRQYGTASICIHEKQCLTQWEKENAELPPSLKRVEPIKPQITIETARAIHGTKTGSYDLDAINAAAFAALQVQYVPCELCGRTFLPDSFLVHARSCQGYSKRKLF